MVCDLIIHLYIDKNPRNKITKPNLIRVVEDELITDIENKMKTN